MRVIECDECGDTITADTDEELAQRLGAHLRSEHDQQPDDEALAELVGEEAYDAMDS